MTSMIKRFFYGALMIAIVVSATSCRSHKKSHSKDSVETGEILSVRKEKKNKKNREEEIGILIAEESKNWIGTPYKYGHSEKGVATDCSGMVLILYQEIANIKVPRNSAQQAEFCEELKENNIRPGDLVFFATGKDPKKVSHVGVMLDKNKFIHASASKGVIMSEMTTPYYRRKFIKFGRVPRR